MDVATFRAATGPAFADPAVYTDATITYWLGIAGNRLTERLWAENLSEGTVLFVAHRLVLAQMMAAGGSGLAAPVSSKSVGGVSIAYNWEAGSLEGGGNYNLTAYGREFLLLARMIGMGVVQL